MKKHIPILMLFITFTISLSYGQDFIEKKHSEQFIENCIVEVFQAEANTLVFNETSRRYKLMDGFIRNQVVVEYRPEFIGKKITSTNQLSLNNKYNPNIRKDKTYNKNAFNPLKYNLSMNPTSREIYRIGNSDYIMIISQSK
jgi:hypothetical protein